MKTFAFFSNAARFLFLFSLIFFQTARVFSQSGQVRENSVETQTISANADEKNKAEDVSKLEAFDYVEPQAVEDFIKKLNELGAKKYRLRDLTQIPKVVEDKFSADTGNDEITRLTIYLAGIVRLDETKYEYKMLDVEKTSDLAEALNRAAKEGFNPREVIDYSSSIEFDRNSSDTLFASLETLLSMPRISNLILLERETENVNPPREFQVLRAGYGIGKKPTEKMNALLAESIRQNFYPIALFIRQNFGGEEQKDEKLKIFDFYYAAIVEKTPEEPPVELEFVRGLTWSNFDKRVNKLAAQGYKIGNTGFIYAMMVKDRAESVAPPKNYHWINAQSSGFANQLTGISDAGGRLSGTGKYQTEVVLADTPTQAIFENRLVFEMPSANETARYEYRILPMVADAPQTAFIGKTVVAGDEPIRKFRRLVKQGFYFSNLISAHKKVAAVFERRRSN